MEKFKTVYTCVCIADVLLLLALGVMWATGVAERMWDVAFPGPDDAVISFSISSMDWKQIGVMLLFFGCPASLLILWLGYLMFVWDGKLD